MSLGMPLFARLREKLVYRLVWNGGVVCFFLVLLRHALRGDLAYVLEDGLVLAALCQGFELGRAFRKCFIGFPGELIQQLLSSQFVRLTI